MLAQLQELEAQVPDAVPDFHSDNGGEFLHWPLHRHLTGRLLKLPGTRSRTYRQHDHTQCEQQNWTPGRQRCGDKRFGPPERMPGRNDLYAHEGSQFTNPGQPTFKLWQRE